MVPVHRLLLLFLYFFFSLSFSSGPDVGTGRRGVPSALKTVVTCWLLSGRRAGTVHAAFYTTSKNISLKILEIRTDRELTRVTVDLLVITAQDSLFTEEK